ncbi:ribonuclease D [Nocardiopsis quinghaiensis]|uniref:ribonuclease D n=1 Tax=Nocardiopsis quinghaiensis TaxID=464995 RepID=UPI001CC2681D|nr:ribonuclease D [Nocardiopsis quinghaiensis]
MQVCVGDLTEELLALAKSQKSLACDIETTGLDWNADRIGTVQIYAPDIGAIVVRVSEKFPSRLIQVLESNNIAKVFHHAPFDLRFLRAHWGVKIKNVRCTKVGSRLLRPAVSRESHSLKPLLKYWIGVSIDKSQQQSDWVSSDLSSDQLRYAVSDVRYLLDLLSLLNKEMMKRDLFDIYNECMRFLPTQVELDVSGQSDIFAH